MTSMMKTAEATTASIASYETADDVSWQVERDWQATLLSEEGLRLEEWLSDGRAAVVKAGTHRTVYRVDLAERSFYLKHYRCRTLTSASRHMVRASASVREWRKARAVAAREIRTFRPIALGEQRRGGLVRDSFLVTEAIADSCSVDDFVEGVIPRLPAVERGAMRRELIERLAVFCADAHDRGIDHDDFHTGNILVQSVCEDGRRGLRLYLIDLPGIRLSGSLDWRRSRRSLAMLHGGWFDRIGAGEAWRFWRVYVAARRHIRVTDARAAGLSVGVRSRRAHRRVIRSRDRRIFQSNRDFRRIRVAGLSVHRRAQLPAEVCASLAGDPAAVLYGNLERPLKLSHSTVVVQATIPTADGPVDVAVKRCRRQGLWKRWLGVFRTSRALRGWFVGHALRARGVETVEPLWVCQGRRPVAGRDSYLVTRWIAGSENLHLYGWRLAARRQGVRDAVGRNIAEQLGWNIGRIHAWSASHRDLKACNFAVVERGDAVSTVLLDLDGVRFRWMLRWRDRVRDLSRLASSFELQLWVTARMRARFLKAYFEAAGIPAAWKRRLVSDVTERVNRRLRRRQASGRPLS